ncbi:class I SAM-dependent methyltransferase [Woodsholea maritima]|uniref:class I SAM-dependent methyltransferase n=1 Tax=Woodsholea maritima TaxID=240237 RepID=UPI00036BC721|nr:methyltransferase domain-containing protein [Woodsholea maritima]
MRTDAVELARFYRRKAGQSARAMIARRLQALWPHTHQLDLLGFGFAGPYLDLYRGEARRALAFMPGSQGAVHWPDDALNASCLGDELHLPFKEAQFDRIIVAHGLEEAHAPRRLLRELWRVLAPEGRMVVITAHRAGLWSQTDGTPLGAGRPYSKGQLSELFDDTLFEPLAWSRALYVPPVNWLLGPRTSEIFEHLGERVYPGFGGILMAEVIKHIGAVRPKGTLQRRTGLEGLRPGALSPVPSANAHHKASRRSHHDADPASWPDGHPPL